MNIIAVAKDGQLLNEIIGVVHTTFPLFHIEPFANTMMAVKYSFNSMVEMAFVSTSIHTVDCFQFETTLRKINPEMTVIFIVDEEDDAEYMKSLDSLCIHRPVTEQAIKEIISA